MARCKHCGEYIEIDPVLEGYLTIEPDTCDECWELYTDMPADYPESSDADPGL